MLRYLRMARQDMPEEETRIAQLNAREYSGLA